MNKRLLGAMTAIMILAAGLFLNAWSDPGPGPDHAWHEHGSHHGMFGMMDHSDMMGPGMMDSTMGLVMLAEKLDLTPDQRDKIGKIMDDARPKMRSLMFEMMDSHKQMKSMMHANDKVDDSKLRQLADQQGKLMADMMYITMKSRTDMLAVLTDEQRKRLDGFHHGFMRHGGDGMMERGMMRHRMSGQESGT